MRATIIIPTYNRPDLLGRELSCLARQKGDLIEEVLVCDDGSSTDTEAAIRPFVPRVPGLVLLRQEHEGFRAGQARNMGIRTARGDIIVFIDDDLLLADDFVLQHVAAHAHRMNGSPPRRAVVGFRYRTPTPPSAEMPSPQEMLSADPDDRVSHLGPDGERLASHPHPWFFVYSCNLSVPNDREVVLFDESFVGWGMEDSELGYRLHHAGFQIVVQPSARVLHVESPRPHDPFRCEERGILPRYDSYVRNMVQFIDKYPHDRGLHDLLASELRWYVRDESGRHWVKNGLENDAGRVIAEERRLRADARSKTAAKGACAPQAEPALRPE